MLIQLIRISSSGILAQESYRKIDRDGLKIGTHLIRHSCPMMFIGVYMFHHVAMLFMPHVGRSKFESSDDFILRPALGITTQ